MVNSRNHQKIEQECECEDRFIWPRIKASTIPSVDPPPVIDPIGNIIPTVNRYLYIATSNINGFCATWMANGATLAASLFWDDAGNPATAFKIFNPNGYVNLYINAGRWNLHLNSYLVNLKSK